MPRFHKCRHVPFALRDKVEEALKAQVAAGELVLVERSEWAGGKEKRWGSTHLW